MAKVLSLAAMVALLIASAAPSALAAKGHGASAFAPGHLMRAHPGVRGASSFAPGHLFKRFGSVPGHPGASGFAPGHRFR